MKVNGLKYRLFTGRKIESVFNVYLDDYHICIRNEADATIYMLPVENIMEGLNKLKEQKNET